MNDKIKKSSALFMPSGCLTGDALMLFVSGSLKGSELIAAQQHIFDCPLCADAADGLRMWLSEDKTENSTIADGNKIPAEFSGKHSGKAHSDKSFRKPLNEFHLRTDLLNKHVRQRLHSRALIEASESKRLSYKPFVWLAAAASIILFIGGFYVVWMQTQSDRQKLALKAQEMEYAAHIEDSLLRSISDTADIYVLAMNRKRDLHKSQTSENMAVVSEDMVSDLEIDENVPFPAIIPMENKSLPEELVVKEIAYSGQASGEDSSASGKANQAVVAEEVVVTALGISREKKSLAYSSADMQNEKNVTSREIQKLPDPTLKSSTIEESEAETAFTIVEEMPLFPGGTEKMISFLAEHLNYPVAASENGIQGTVYVSFIVKKDGRLTNLKVIRGIGGGCDEEAVRVVGKMPRWKPGTQSGKAVDVQYNLPVLFKLK